MFLTNQMKAQLIRKNRNTDFVYDDEDKEEAINLDVIPYNIDQAIRYGLYTVPEATGYFILRRQTDIKEGDQILFANRQYSVLKVMDRWIFNRIESIEVAVK
jgi:predicted nucleotide-binding protein (sugar kinase/HSP70/actin superfamily)